MRKCPKCKQVVNDPEGNFCDCCGIQLIEFKEICPICGRYEPEGNFCSKCGVDLI